MWSMKRLRHCFFEIPFLILTDHEALESLDKGDELHIRVQRWLEFLNAYQYKLVYGKAKDNVHESVCHAIPYSPWNRTFMAIWHSSISKALTGILYKYQILGLGSSRQTPCPP